MKWKVEKNPLGLDNKTYILSESENRKLILKSYSNRTTEEVERIGKLQNYLASKGLQVPKAQKLPDQMLLIQEYIKGEHLGVFSDGIVKEIATLIKGVNLLKLPKVLLKETSEFNYEKYFLLCKTWNLAPQLKDVYKGIDRSYRDKLPKVFIHGDVIPANLLFNKDNISGLIDWDHAGLGLRLYEVARAQIFFSYDKNTFNKNKLDIFLSAYKNLSSEEQLHLYDEMRLSIIKIMLESYYTIEIKKLLPVSILKNKYQDLSFKSLFVKLLGIPK